MRINLGLILGEGVRMGNDEFGRRYFFRIFTKGKKPPLSAIGWEGILTCNLRAY